MFAIFLMHCVIGCGMGGKAPTLSVKPNAQQLFVGQKLPLSAVLTDVSGDRDVTSSATWSARNQSVAVAGPVATCVQSGTGSVSANVGEFSASTEITCEPLKNSQKTVQSLEMTHLPASIVSDTWQKLAVKAYFTDGTDEDVTGSVSWSYADQTASVSQTGLVDCNHPGNAALTASYGGATAAVSFTCVMRSPSSTVGFTEHSKVFYGPFNSWLDIKKVFGAVGDGKADDTQALQAALDSFSKSAKVLWLPAGRYRITKTLRLASVSGFALLGEDPRNTILEWDGPAGQEMMVLDGMNHFRVGRIAFDGNSRASTGLHLAWSQAPGGNYYPTGNLIHDVKFRNSQFGIRADWVGETTIDRDEFRNISDTGIQLGNWNALNWNIIDSLFVDCGWGVTNFGMAGGYNVLNSVFVRSKNADMGIGNTGAFSARNNISYDSASFLSANKIGSGSNTVLQGNLIVRPKNVVIGFSNLGPLTLIDNKVVGIQPDKPFVFTICADPTGVVAVGNVVGTTGPWSGQMNLDEFDEDTSQTYDGPIPSIPDETYVPAQSQGRIFEVPENAPSSVIQGLVNAAAASSGGIVHIAGFHVADQTINVPDARVAIIGDGQTSGFHAHSLIGPVIKVTGGQVDIEELEITEYVSGNTQIETAVPDLPSTRVFCDECISDSATNTGVLLDGMEEALVEFKVATMGGHAAGMAVHGGANQVQGRPVLGEVNAFSMTADSYVADSGAELFISDGFHDGGQGSSVFQISGNSKITQSGGSNLSSNPFPMLATKFSGELALVGVQSSSQVRIDQASPGNILSIGFYQTNELNPLLLDAVTTVTGSFGSYAQLHTSGERKVENSIPGDQWMSDMLRTARTRGLTARGAANATGTEIRISRIYGKASTGLRITPSTTAPAMMSRLHPASAQAAQAYTSSGQPQISIAETAKGYAVLQTADGYVHDLRTENGDVVDHSGDAGVATSQWLLRRRAGGAFALQNRGTGKFLTFDSSGQVSTSVNDGAAQLWFID
ncbi:MAG: hypothetical protein JSS87_10350 [Acidobacteria bacterium]|nr:hypothetical protein [Acidobacteriota bacterium]